MKTFAQQLKWQFILLGKNNIISISFGVTIIYGIILYLLRDIQVLDKVMVSLVLNDPSVIGYFFIALAIYTEMKHGILPAIFVSSLSLHQMLLSKTLALSIIGTVCAFGLAVSVRGFNFDILNFLIGVFGICILSTLLGLIMLTYSNEFLKFTMLSVPLFIVFISVPMLIYLGAFDIGIVKYLFPVQGSLDLIDHSVSGTEISFIYAYLSILVFVPVFYALAYRIFNRKVVHQ